MADIENNQKYRTIVKQLLSEYARYQPSHGDIEVQTVFDAEADHYQVVALGWNQKERIYSGSHSHEVQVCCSSLLISMASEIKVYLTRPGTAIWLFYSSRH